MKKVFTIFNIILIFFAFVLFGCDSNLLGGSKSHLGENYEPGKRVESEPPTIGAISNFTMDENDVQTIPFTIGDPDTFMMCSSIYVRMVSSNTTLIDSSGFVVGGAYPNCTLQITPKNLQYGVSTVRVEVFDFWTVVSTSFTLTVNHVLTPGSFVITDAEGQDRSIMVTWQNAAYMSGTSARYSLFYRIAGTGSYTQISPVTSPYLVTGLTNGEDYDIYIMARNSIGTRNSPVVQASPTKYKLEGGEFINGSNQYENTSPRNYLTYSSTGGRTNELQVTTTPRGYRVFMNGQGNIISGVGP